MTYRRLSQVTLKSCRTPCYDVSDPVQGSIRVFTSTASPPFHMEADSLQCRYQLDCCTVPDDKNHQILLSWTMLTIFSSLSLVLHGLFFPTRAACTSVLFSLASEGV